MQMISQHDKEIYSRLLKEFISHEKDMMSYDEIAALDLVDKLTDLSDKEKEYASDNRIACSQKKQPPIILKLDVWSFVQGLFLDRPELQSLISATKEDEKLVEKIDQLSHEQIADMIHSCLEKDRYFLKVSNIVLDQTENLPDDLKDALQSAMDDLVKALQRKSYNVIIEYTNSIKDCLKKIKIWIEENTFSE